MAQIVPNNITNLTQLATRKHNDLQLKEAPIPHIVLSKLEDVPEFQKWMKKRMGHQVDALITAAAGQNLASGIAFDGTYIWVNNEITPVQILKIDPVTNTIIATVTGAAGQNSGLGILYDGIYIWATLATTPAQILKIDPATNTIVATITAAAGQDNAFGITFDGTYIWVNLYTSPVQILKIDPSTNTIVATVTGGAGSNLGNEITFDGTHLWSVLGTSPARILKINPLTNAIIATVTGAGGQNDGESIAFDGTNIWAGLFTNPVQILKINPVTNTIAATVTGAVGQFNARGITYDGTYMWANLQSTQILKIDPSTATVVSFYQKLAGDSGFGITFDGTYIWANMIRSPSRIYKIYAYLRKVDSFFRKRTDVTASRALNTTYTNSDPNRTMRVIATVRCAITVAAGNAYAQGKADTAALPITAASGIVGIQVGLLGEDNSFKISFYVMPLEKYRIDSAATNGTVTLGNWFESLI